MLQTWTAIQEYLRSKYTLEHDTPDMLSMVWVYEDGRSQKVLLRKYKAFGRELVEIKSPFARRDEVNAEVLMTKNSELPLVTTVLSGDVYLAVYNVLLGQVAPDDLELIVGRVAAIADALEVQHGTGDVF
jgi:hypothetical protein